MDLGSLDRACVALYTEILPVDAGSSWNATDTSYVFKAVMLALGVWRQERQGLRKAVSSLHSPC
jgi:hypothetical protein